MTILTDTPAPSLMARRFAFLLMRLRRHFNSVTAYVIARYERQAAREALRNLGDRELADIGISRSQIDAGFDELAQVRRQMQQAKLKAKARPVFKPQLARHQPN